MQFLAKILIAPLIFVMSLAGYDIQPKNLGAQNATGGERYFIQGGGISASQTTINLTKLGYTQPGGTYAKFTMQNFGDLGCMTLQPGNTSGKQEFVSFTGVTQNSDGTAQLTGVSRGLERYSPYSASTTLQTAHSGGTDAVISNSPPCFYQNYATLKNDQTFSGISTFTIAPIIGDDALSTSTAQVATRDYVNGVSFSGGVNASEIVKGVIELATGLEAASSTSAGSTAGRLVLPAIIATSSPYTQGNYVPITNARGVLGPQFIATTSIDVPNGYTYTANQTFGGTNSFTGATSFSNSGTTTFSGGISSGKLFGAPYFNATSTTATSTFNGGIIMQYATTTNMTVSGTMVGAIGSSHEIKTGTCNLNAGSPSLCSVTVTCSAGKVVVGGGVSGVVAAGNPTNTVDLDSYPSASNTWQVDFEGPNGSSATLTAYAVCVNK